MGIPFSLSLSFSTMLYSTVSVYPKKAADAMYVPPVKERRKEGGGGCLSYAFLLPRKRALLDDRVAIGHD